MYIKKSQLSNLVRELSAIDDPAFQNIILEQYKLNPKLLNEGILSFLGGFLSSLFRGKYNLYQKSSRILGGYNKDFAQNYQLPQNPTLEQLDDYISSAEEIIGVTHNPPAAIKDNPQAKQDLVQKSIQKTIITNANQQFNLIIKDLKKSGYDVNHVDSADKLDNILDTFIQKNKELATNIKGKASGQISYRITQYISSVLDYYTKNLSQEKTPEPEKLEKSVPIKSIDELWNFEFNDIAFAKINNPFLQSETLKYNKLIPQLQKYVGKSEFLKTFSNNLIAKLTTQQDALLQRTSEIDTSLIDKITTPVIEKINSNIKTPGDPQSISSFLFKNSGFFGGNLKDDILTPLTTLIFASFMPKKSSVFESKNLTEAAPPPYLPPAPPIGATPTTTSPISTTIVELQKITNFQEKVKYTQTKIQSPGEEYKLDIPIPSIHLILNGTLPDAIGADQIYNPATKNNQNPYELLGVTQFDNDDNILKARDRAIGTAKNNPEQTAAINEAYESIMTHRSSYEGIMGQDPYELFETSPQELKNIFTKNQLDQFLAGKRPRAEAKAKSLTGVQNSTTIQAIVDQATLKIFKDIVKEGLPDGLLESLLPKGIINDINNVVVTRKITANAISLWDILQKSKQLPPGWDDGHKITEQAKQLFDSKIAPLQKEILESAEELDKTLEKYKIPGPDIRTQLITGHSYNLKNMIDSINNSKNQLKKAMDESQKGFSSYFKHTPQQTAYANIEKRFNHILNFVKRRWN